MSDFGDIEPDDAYSVGALAHPEQVTYRLHELRLYLDELTGGHVVARFEQLRAEEQHIASAVGVVIVQWLFDVDPDDPTAAARNLHQVRRYWSGDTLATWDDLPDDDRRLAVELLTAIIDWLHREGTLPEGH